MLLASHIAYTCLHNSNNHAAKLMIWQLCVIKNSLLVMVMSLVLTAGLLCGYDYNHHWFNYLCICVHAIHTHTLRGLCFHNSV